MLHVDIYTDGACSGNPGPGGWGAVLVCGERRKELSGGKLGVTNNLMEVLAVFKALEALRVPCDVTVYTDSRNVVGWLQDGWRRNNLLIRQICATIDLLIAAAGHTVKFEWVKGHAGDPENERADRLATAAIP